ncbi:DNA-directed RNA polymerase sigma-70 factor [Sinosporangium siamense]|uniref:DNA-directed RNA polymerase sigma-70 factor n=1 Tax=Sinosporangium siamense TaxID=1367973 RepID=A0A919VBP3_9ACTN|nr:RNA polymerase sigma factor [Sinosporangium siamense]GII96737.1 DNA-directed RNA polymerase sigma-70 factor [Sinosporangium siamense]
MIIETAELDDAELIRRSVGDPEQFATLFDRYARQIHRYAARRIGEQAADDVVGETFLAAFRRRGSYDLSVPLARPWLYGIATTFVARHRRREERLLRALSRTGVDPLPEAMDHTVVSRVAASDKERELAAALASLSRGDRDVLLLVAWGDLSYEEVSQALGIPLGTVRSRLHRARKKSRVVLGDEEELA